MNNKTTIIKPVFSFSPLSLLSLLVGGGLFLLGLYMVVRYFFGAGGIVDTYDAIAVWQNNSEGNWDIAYSIYHQHGDSWTHEIDRDIYYEGDANLIAKIPGDDNDPDIASTKHKALAVWSNTGADGNEGADIWLAFYNGGKMSDQTTNWSKPTRLFAIPGDDVDPTVYMLDPDHAMVVWINRKGESQQLYYSEYIAGHWSDPDTVDSMGASVISIPELSYTTLPGSRYLLIFTAKMNDGNKAVISTYSSVNGWKSEVVDGQVQALVDESVPAKHRTSASMHTDGRAVAAAWPDGQGMVEVISADPGNRNASAAAVESGTNPIILFDPNNSRAVDTLLFATTDSLINVTPVNGPRRQVVTSGELEAVRADAVYLYEPADRDMVAVFETKTEEPSEIYFSSVEVGSQEWSVPKRIDLRGFAGEDRNPAVAPLRIIFSEDGMVDEDEFGFLDPECGNDILEAGEQCEFSIACKNKAEICDWEIAKKGGFGLFGFLFAGCECIGLDDTVEPPPNGGGFGGDSEVTYGGTSCGFTGMKVVGDIDHDGDGVTVQFLPETNPANGVVTLTGNYATYETNRLVLFPGSPPPQDAYYATLQFLNGDKTAVLTGVDAETGFQLCTGTFERGAEFGPGQAVPAAAPADAGGLVPALPPEDTSVPDLPPEF